MTTLLIGYTAIGLATLSYNLYDFCRWGWHPSFFDVLLMAWIVPLWPIYWAMWTFAKFFLEGWH